MSDPQPNSTHCFVCGINNPVGLKLRFYQVEEGEVHAQVTLPEYYQGYPGVAHGGIIAAMLDEIAGRSHMHSNPPRFMFTARLEIQYRKNVPTGEPLHLIGHAGETKGRKAYSHSAIYSQDGDLLAEADVLLIDVPKNIIENVDLEALGWKVYPEANIPPGGIL